MDDGTVHFASRHKYKVERLKLVRFSFNVVTDVSGFKKEQLVKAEQQTKKEELTEEQKKGTESTGK